MMIAGRVDLAETLAALAVRRPVFHSERDFQVALAWQVHLADPYIRVCLESRPKEGVHLDLEFVSPDSESSTAIELKYFTRKWAGVSDGQQFSLKQQGANDYGRYGLVKDIQRIEEFVRLRPGSNGAAIALTNDEAYSIATPHSTASDTAFRIGEGDVLGGLHEWRRPPASAKHGPALELEGRYTMRWSKFSTFDLDGWLKQLVVEVPRVVA